MSYILFPAFVPKLFVFALSLQDGHSAKQVQDRLLGHHCPGRHKHQAQEGTVSSSCPFVHATLHVNSQTTAGFIKVWLLLLKVEIVHALSVSTKQILFHLWKWICFLQMLYIKRKKSERLCPSSSWKLFDLKQNCRKLKCQFQSVQPDSVQKSCKLSEPGKNVSGWKQYLFKRRESGRHYTTLLDIIPGV